VCYEDKIKVHQFLKQRAHHTRFKLRIVLEVAVAVFKLIRYFKSLGNFKKDSQFGFLLYLCGRMHVCVCVNACLCVSICGSVSVSIYVCVSVCSCVSVFL
jgi:hypothetical protein